MKSFLQLVCSARIVQSSLRIALVVGSALNLINQGAVILTGSEIDWFRLWLNYLVPYCVASYSAAKNERKSDE